MRRIAVGGVLESLLLLGSLSPTWTMPASACFFKLGFLALEQLVSGPVGA